VKELFLLLRRYFIYLNQPIIIYITFLQKNSPDSELRRVFYYFASKLKIMIKRVFVLVTIVTLAACNGGNKGPVMADEGEPVNLNQDATNHVASVSNSKKDISIEQEEGVITIGKLLNIREELVGKIISVKGEVTKYNPSIMGMNWVHIQDGTDHKGEYDLTITTADVVSVGDQVVFTGVLALERDFGYGYKYSTILEGAELKK
jgi:hypothetical protein